MAKYALSSLSNAVGGNPQGQATRCIGILHQTDPGLQSIRDKRSPKPGTLRAVIAK